MNNNVASERVKLHLSQKELASCLHVEEKVVNGWESGTVELRGSDVIALTALFGCSADYLLGRCEDRVSHLRVIYSMQCLPGSTPSSPIRGDAA